jgi:hypothetical protein
MLKKFVTTFLLLSIFSCGFKTIYQEENSLGTGNKETSYISELAAIRIQKNRTRLDQELKNNLYDLLNPDYLKIEPKYLLVLTMVKSIQGTFITGTGSAGRQKVVLNIHYRLKELETAKTISKGSVFVSDNYDVTLNRYGTYVTDEYIQLNLTKLAAQNLRNSLVNDFIEISRGDKKPILESELEEDDKILKKPPAPKLDGMM